MRKLQNLQSYVCASGMIYNSNNYPTDHTTTKMVTGLMSGLGNGRSGRVKKVFTIEKEMISFSTGQFTAYAQAMIDHGEDAYDNMISHMVNLQVLLDDVLQSPQDLIDYDTTTGWPTNPAQE